MTIIYKGRRVTLEVYRTVLPNNHVMNVERVIFPKAVAVLPIYGGDRVVLIRQFRPVINDYIFEIPAGVVEEKESEDEALIRELREEIGAEVINYGKLFEGFTSPGYSTEYLVIYYANVRSLGEAMPEEHEVIERVIVGLSEAMDMVRRGEIKDLKTALALTLYALKGSSVTTTW